jgi:alanine-glyoxylate transaminase/serine-glyoxylate transaminase/serine-pyruvate transaminase
MNAGPWMDNVLILTPGPTPLHPAAQAALGWPMRGHMDPDVMAYNDRIVEDLRSLYATSPTAFTALLAGSGSLGMEAGLGNLIEPGTRVLIATNGVFGDRMVEMARRLGAEVRVLRAAPGEALDVAALAEALEREEPTVLSLVHGETSTGVLNPVAEIAPLVAKFGVLWSVDAVTTVGMLPFEMERWGIDYAYTGSQKCLSAPPGVAPIAVSERLMQQLERRQTAVSSWTADLLNVRRYWEQGEAGRRYHHTVPIHLHWATGEAIRAALHEGVAARSDRAQRIGAALLGALATIGFEPFVRERGARLPTVLALTLPVGLDDAVVREQLRVVERISVTGGLGPTAGRIWRLGLMGEAAREEHYARLMEALARILPGHGFPAAIELPQQFEAALGAQAAA